MRPHTTPSWSATWISVRICTPTLYYLEVPPCTLVLLTECRKKLLPWLLLQWKSRSLLPQKGNTQYGLVVQSWLLCLPSNKCGSPNRSTTNQAHLLCTESVSKYFDIYFPKNLYFLFKFSCIFFFFTYESKLYKKNPMH